MIDGKRERERQRERQRYIDERSPEKAITQHRGLDPALNQVGFVVIQTLDTEADKLNCRRIAIVDATANPRVWAYVAGPDSEAPNDPISMLPVPFIPASYYAGVVWEGAVLNDVPEEEAIACLEILALGVSYVYPLLPLFTLKAQDRNWNTATQ